MNSTPLKPTATMRFTALLPPPPTPMTLIFAPRRVSASSVKRSGSASRTRESNSLICASSSSEELPENSPQPPGHAAEGPGAHAGHLRHAVAMRVEHEPDRRGKRRTGYVIGQPAHVNW